ncbi:hypothetical protein [Actinokineospora sp. NBRC 105648]|nr:hypothetical protein [Actinokineospora sp. NBRC 105648]GLZ40228.1 hypothetical protein Acsp05_38520 [Actinokineospora sp. NBRC 105648]
MSDLGDLFMSLLSVIGGAIAASWAQRKVKKVEPAVPEAVEAV